MKKYIKKIINKKNRTKIKNLINFLINFKYRNKIIINKNIVKSYRVFDLKNKNVFCGYYDLNPIKNNMILVNIFNKKENKIVDADVGYFNLDDGNYNKIGSTECCSWQQGSRLRWSNTKKDCVYYNRVFNNKYCTVLKNILTKEEKIIEYPLYDIEKNEKYGVSLNFSRLERLRPGYGYDRIPENVYENAPKNDGLFLINLEENVSELLLSLYDVALTVDKKLQFEHYLNHLSFSPDSNKIMFFHLWNQEENGFKWKNQLCVYYLKEKKYEIIENNDIISHYCWIDDNRLLITFINNDKKEGYRIYDLCNKEKNDIKDIRLLKDGHPSIYDNRNVFCSDTYPNSRCLQSLFFYDIEAKKYNFIMDIYANPFLRKEKRCDLHPKVDKENNIIVVDSTYKSKKRSIVLLYVNGLE